MTLTVIKGKDWPIVRRRFRAEAAPRTFSRYAFIRIRLYNRLTSVRYAQAHKKGRIAWNIVTNPSVNAAHNFGQELTPHDERYEWASEYVAVTYKLWEGSWDDGALVQDREAGIHGDFEKIHRIHHVGKRYSVEGPHLVAPSPQRTPLLFQAGSSEAGMKFAAANAEAQFLIAPRPEVAAAVIKTTRGLLPKYGRRGEDIKFVQGLSFVVGSTEEEAARKGRELDEAIDAEAMIAH
jgi:alkanesulfonate monooxygenase SsuD/methylene tetrahydromethanopterin reductase-like flavin-dependent oxidoreductase (luciferase family)